jgi:hypothetical protein
VLTLSAPRNDDVLDVVTVPPPAGPGPSANTTSHLESVQTELIARRLPAGAPNAPLPTNG